MLNISNESRVFQGPWTSLVKGRGLGAITKKFNTKQSACIKQVIKYIDKTPVKTNAYNQFSKVLCHFILDFNDPDVLFFQRKELHARIDNVIQALIAIDEPYLYISASAIFFEMIGKLGLDPNLWVNKEIYLVDDALAKLTLLPTSNEKECYKALQVYGNLFLGIGHIGQVDKLIEGKVDYVQQALSTTDGLKGIWHRGRGISAFLTVLGMIDLAHYATKPEYNYLKELVSFVDVSLKDQLRVDERPNEYVFSILLMINCIGVFDKLEYLEYKRDWVQVSTELLEILPIDLKAIFSHYYLSVLDNLGLSNKAVKTPKKHLLDVLDSLLVSEGGELSYMAYTYCIDIAYKLGLATNLANSLASHLLENISTKYDFKNGHQPTNLFYRSGFMRLGYALTAMGQMNRIEDLLDKKTSGGISLVESILENHLENWEGSDDSFMTLNHALIDLSLSQRGENVSPSEVDKNIVLYRNDIPTIPIWDMEDQQGIALHAYFPGMNSRRHYENLSRDLYEKGNDQVRAIFEKSYQILNEGKTVRDASDLSAFFFEDTVWPDDVSEKWNAIGSSMTVYNLALLEHMKTSNQYFRINSFGGESYGMIAAAIASNALSLEDGLKLANNVLGLIYKCAHSNNFGMWHIVSLSGEFIHSRLKTIKQEFSEGIDVFRWQTINDKKEDVHVYIHDNIFDQVKTFIAASFGNLVCLEEFKQPTKEIVHSPKLAAARIDISNLIVDENIIFSTPNTPIVANNGTGIASSKNDIRNLMLDMVNIPMYSAQSFRLIKDMIPSDTDAIVEFGYGQKTRSFIAEHSVEQPFFEYFGDIQRLSDIRSNLKHSKSSAKSQYAVDSKLSKNHDDTELTHV